MTWADLTRSLCPGDVAGDRGADRPGQRQEVRPENDRGRGGIGRDSGQEVCPPRVVLAACMVWYGACPG